MKRCLMLTLLVLSSFTFIGSVHAVNKKTAEMTCVYNAENSSVKADATQAKCYFDSKGNYSCYYLVNGKDKGVSEYNAKDGKNYYNKNRECPKYLVYVQRNSAFAPYEGHLTNDLSDANKVSAERQAATPQATIYIYPRSSSQLKDEEIKVDEEEDPALVALENVKSYNESLSNHGKKMGLSEYCTFSEKENLWKDKINLEKLCRDARNGAFETIKKWDKYVEDEIKSRHLLNSDVEVKNYKYLRDEVIVTLGKSSLNPDKNEAVAIYPDNEKEKPTRATKNTGYERRKITCPLGPNVTKDLYNVLNIFKIAAPILVVVLSIFDAIKTIATADAYSEMKKVALKFAKRAVIAMVLFFAPVLVNQIMVMANVWDENGTCNLSEPKSNESDKSDESKESNESNESNKSNEPTNEKKSCSEYNDNIELCESDSECEIYEVPGGPKTCISKSSNSTSSNVTPDIDLTTDQESVVIKPGESYIKPANDSSTNTIESTANAETACDLIGKMGSDICKSVKGCDWKNNTCIANSNGKKDICTTVPESMCTNQCHVVNGYCVSKSSSE